MSRQNERRWPTLARVSHRRCCVAQRLLRALHDLGQTPALLGRQRAGLHDSHTVAHAGAILLVVRLVARRRGVVRALQRGLVAG